MGFPQLQGHGRTSCQAPELLPRPEELRVWLLPPQVHPVAVTVEILAGRGQKGTVATISSLYSHSFGFPIWKTSSHPKCAPRALPIAQEGAFPKWESPRVSSHLTQSPKAHLRPPASLFSPATRPPALPTGPRDLGTSLRALASSPHPFLSRGRCDQGGTVRKLLSGRWEDPE